MKKADVVNMLSKVLDIFVAAGERVYGHLREGGIEI